MSSEPVGYCLITGAAGGIGQVLVKVFADAGYLVLGLDCIEQPADLNCTYWHQIDLTRLVSDEVYAEEFLEAVREQVSDKGLHVLINNAAVQILGGVDSLTRQDWQKTLDINLVAPFILVQGLLNELVRTGGSVVNIGSIHARLTKKNFVAYATSKAALAGLTRALAVDLGARVRVNAIEPAAIDTEMLKAGFNNDASLYNQLELCHPSQRIGQPIELAKFALMITRDDFRFLHGACLSLDGGIAARLFDPIRD